MLVPCQQSVLVTLVRVPVGLVRVPVSLVRVPVALVRVPVALAHVPASLVCIPESREQCQCPAGTVVYEGVAVQHDAGQVLPGLPPGQDGPVFPAADAAATQSQHSQPTPPARHTNYVSFWYIYILILMHAQNSKEGGMIIILYTCTCITKIQTLTVIIMLSLEAVYPRVKLKCKNYHTCPQKFTAFALSRVFHVKHCVFRI